MKTRVVNCLQAKAVFSFEADILEAIICSWFTASACTSQTVMGTIQTQDGR